MNGIVNNSLLTGRYARTALRASVMLLVLTAAAGFGTSTIAASKAKPLSLIVFAPNDSSTELSKQKAIVAEARDGFKSRDIGVVYVVGQNVSAELGPEPVAIPVKLRSHFRITRHDFRVILTTKSGETQLLSDTPVSADQLFQTIDARPAPDEPGKPHR
jgi:hypothetical protein